MRLGDAFSAIAHKRLVAVEVDPKRSNGHELNTGPGLRAFFGEGERAETLVTWLRLDDEGVDLRLDGSLTYYKSHKDPTRNEWRVYYTGEPFRPEDEGGHVILLRGNEGTVWGIVVPTASTWWSELEALLGIELESGEIRRGGANRGATLPEAALDARQLSFRAQLLLEELGIEETSGPLVASDAEIVTDAFGEGDGWPSTEAMTQLARQHSDEHDDADDQLLAWLEREEALFRALERIRISRRLELGFIEGGAVDVDAFISFSLSVQNRRKSRRGHSLERHLAALLDRRGVRYANQEKTEGNRTPDFLLPGIAEYRAWNEGDPRLLMLAAKTTCKDRWRQILTEAAKIPNKHLCTLQPGLSDSQLEEMREERVTLVIPARDHKTHPERWRSTLWSVEQFVHEARSMQAAQA